MKKQILSNLGSNYLSKIIIMALGFFIVPFLTRKLSPELYGVTVLAESSILFFQIVTNSMKTAMGRFATFSLSEGKKEEFVAYLSSGRFLLFGCAAAALVFGGLISYFYPYAIHLDPVHLGETKLLFFLVTLGFTLSIPNIIFSSVLIAKQRPDLVNVAMAGAAILRAALLVVVYTFFAGQSLLAYGWIYLVTSCLQNIFVYALYKKLMPGIRIHRKHFSKDRAREIFSFSLHTSAGHLSEILYDNTALVIIGSFWGPALVAIYSISLKFAQILKRLFIEGSWSLMPTFVDLVAKNDSEKRHRLFMMYTKIMCMISTPLCILLILTARPLIVFWTGEEFVMSAGLLPFHIVPLFVAIPFSVCFCLFCAYGKVKIPSLMSLASAIVNVFLGLLFGVGFSWGLYGIAAAASLTLVIYLGVFFPYYACKIAGESLSKYLIQGFLKPFGLAWAVFGAGYLVFRTQNMEWSLNAATLLASGALSLVYAALAFFFVLDSFERNNIFKIFASFRPRRQKAVRAAPADICLKPEFINK